MGEIITEMLSIIFTTKIRESPHIYRCVAAIDEKRAITFRHDEHKRFRIGDETDIFSIADANIVVKVKVIALSDVADYVVFETISETFKFHANGYDHASLGTCYNMIGIDANGRFNVKNGVISKTREYYMIGSHHSADGDSGSIILNKNHRFIGMVVGKEQYSPIEPKNPSRIIINLSELIPAVVIVGHLPATDNKVQDQV